MGRNPLPWFKFYYGEWANDVQLRSCSLLTRGAWIEIICALHQQQTDRLSFTPAGWANLLGCTLEDVSWILEELRLSGAADVLQGVTSNDHVTVKSRRRERELLDLKSGAERVRRHRSKKAGNGDVTPKKRGRVKKQEVRSTNSTSCCFPGAGDPGPEASTVLVFPVVGGKAKTWGLPRAKLAEWAEAFPGLDVLGECKKAMQWVRDNPNRRKTPGGMTRFLFSWLGREQNRRGGRAAAAGSDWRSLLGGGEDESG